MLLRVRLLDQCIDQNNFMVVSDIRFTQGDSPFIFFQLINGSLDQDFKPSGRRYMPQPGATVTVSLQNVNSANTLTKICTQPFVQDPSIWSFQVYSADGLAGTYTFTLQLTEGTNITYGRASNALSVAPQSGVYVPGIPQSPFSDPLDN
jgi:hypothetical protein